MPLEVAPVLEEERLGVLLALAVAEAALGLGPGDEVVPGEVDLEVLPDVVAYLGLRAPGAAVLLLAYSAGQTRAAQKARCIYIEAHSCF